MILYGLIYICSPFSCVPGKFLHLFNVFNKAFFCASFFPCIKHVLRAQKQFYSFVVKRKGLWNHIPNFLLYWRRSAIGVFLPLCFQQSVQHECIRLAKRCSSNSLFPYRLKLKPLRSYSYGRLYSRLLLQAKINSRYLRCANLLL